MSDRKTSPDDAGRPAERDALRPVDRIEDYAIIVAHVRALGGVGPALAALGVAAEEWATASRWSAAITRETLDGRTELASAFGATYAAETKAIAARAEAVAKAAAAAAEPPPPDVPPEGGPTAFHASTAAAREPAPSAPTPAPVASPLPRQMPSFALAGAVARAAQPAADETVRFTPGAHPSAPVLPFAGGGSPAPDAAERQAPAPRVSRPGSVTVELSLTEELTDGDILESTTDSFDGGTTVDATLPFAASPEDDAATTRLRPLAPVEEERPMPMPLDRYASLCASLAVDAARQVAILDQYNVAGDAHLAAIHAAFRELFARDPASHGTFRAWRANFIARLRARG